MKIDSVELHPGGSSEVAVLSFKDPSRLNPYNVRNVTGLDASDGIAPKYYGASVDATQTFFNLAMAKRELGFSIELNPDFSTNQSYSDLRDDLYRMISSSRTGLVQIQFKEAGVVVAVISGFVSKLESTLFDKDPFVLMTITAQLDPMLKSPNPVSVPVMALYPGDTHIVDNVSTAPHGFDFVMSIVGAITTLTISNPSDSSWSFAVSPAGGFLNGDALHFSSDPKTKALYIARGGATIYLADVIALGSMWPIMFPGDNRFAFSSPGLLVWSSITYYQTYWGV